MTEAFDLENPPTDYSLAFGTGALVVDTGYLHDRPAVFIAPADQPGAVGQKADQSGRSLNALVPGETVLTFPTMEQAKRVADTLCNSHAPALADLAELSAKASPGLWSWFSSEIEPGRQMIADQHVALFRSEIGGVRETDAAFAVACVNFVRDLLASVHSQKL